MSDKKKIIAPYGVDENGKGKALAFQADLSSAADKQFARELELAASSKPKSLQELIMRLVEIQKKGT